MALGSRGRHSPISFCVGAPEEEPHAPLKNAFFSEAVNKGRPQNKLTFWIIPYFLHSVQDLQNQLILLNQL